MGKYGEDAKELLRLVGGRENIAAVSHCMTRMRFVLNAPQKADIKKIEAMKVVKGSFTQTGQFQVIIGNTVADFYNDFVAVSGIEGVSKDAVKQAAKQNQNVVQRMITALAEIFAPLIPAIITGGLILGFRNCIDSLYLFENGTKTLCDISQFWTGVDSFLWLIGEAVFHMLPVGICWSVTKKMGTTQMLGIVLGLTLVSGQLLNAYAVAETAAANIPAWDFGFFKVNMIGYQAEGKKELKAFLTGKVIELKEVNDGVFSEGVLGEGIAIIPEDNILYAPADAVVKGLMPDSRHACGLVMDNGMEMLLHIGMDTVDMQGDGFQYLVEEGQRVSAGMPLIQFDRDKIKAAGHPDTTVCVITEPGNAEHIQFFTGVQGKAKVTVVAAYA